MMNQNDYSDAVDEIYGDIIKRIESYVEKAHVELNCEDDHAIRQFHLGSLQGLLSALSIVKSEYQELDAK